VVSASGGFSSAAWAAAKTPIKQKIKIDPTCLVIIFSSFNITYTAKMNVLH
jgi:hypothetical protein